MKGLGKLDYKIPERTELGHKGTFGKVLNIAGSKYMPGAAYLSSVSALRVGCGYCLLASEDSVIKTVACQSNNIVFVPLKLIKSQKPDVISIGCGLSTTWKAKSIFSFVLTNFSDVPTIIDADGLNILSKMNIKLPENVILTPHPLEASRLLKVDISYILENREEVAKRISEMYKCVTVLKGHNTVISDINGDIYINDSGNSALAKAGSGDVLTGIISGLVAQGLNLFEAAKTGVYIHGLSGELASKKLTEYSVMAEDLVSFIPDAIKLVLSKEI